MPCPLLIFLWGLVPFLKRSCEPPFYIEQAQNRKPRPRPLSSNALALVCRVARQRALPCQRLAPVPIVEIVRRSVSSCANYSPCTRALCLRDPGRHALEDGDGRR